MLKLMPNVDAALDKLASAKCGEIFCQSAKEFTILCCFCQMKIFEFDDFVLHFKNTHFTDNGLLKTEMLDAENTAFRTYANGAAISDPPDERTVECGRQSNGILATDIDQETDEEESDWEPAMAADECTSIKVMPWHRTVSGCTTPADNDDESLAGDDEWQPALGESDATDREDPDSLSCFLKFPAKQTKKGRTRNADKNYLIQKQLLIEAGIADAACEYCDKRFKNAKTLATHMRKYHSERLRKATKNAKPAELEKDDKKTVVPEEKRPEQPQHRCPECVEVFTVKHLLNRHLLNIHGGFKCLQCNKRFREVRQLHAHELKHTGVRGVACDVADCEKMFFTRRAMMNHKRIAHTLSKNYVCDICAYRCSLIETLRVHYRKHTGEKPYPCDVCDRRFASNSLLHEHKVMHSTLRPHICGVCGASFARQKGLYHHRFLHLGVKKFKCKLCDNAYAQLSGLAGHMRKHKEEGHC